MQPFPGTAFLELIAIVDSNKTELFAFLSNALLRSLVQEDKQLVVTSDVEVFSKPPLPDRSSIAPCTHEEADT